MISVSVERHSFISMLYEVMFWDDFVLAVHESPSVFSGHWTCLP